MKRLVLLTDIDFDHSPRVRHQICAETVEEYAAAYARKENLPPPILAKPKEDKLYFVVDGRHRLCAAAKLGRKGIECETFSGSLEDILREALKHNTTHGLKRSQKDKQICVATALQQWPQSSNGALAETCRVDPQTVAAVREKLEAKKIITPSETRVGRDGKRRASTASNSGNPELPEKKEGPVKDRTGYVIPESVLPLWNRANLEVKDALETLVLVRRDLEKADKDKDILWSEPFLNKAIGELNSVIANLSTAIPFAVCAVCQGHPETQPKGDCRGCKGRGYMSKFRWDRVPDKLRELRTKS